MAITREFICLGHGPFESKRLKPKCPHGCSGKFVRQEFRTAPAIGGVAKHVDRELNHLASDYKLTDIRNGADGESVMTTLRKGKNWAPQWGEVSHAKPGFSQRPGEAVPTFSPASYGAQPTGALESIKPGLTQPKPIIAGTYRAPLPT